jgi:hypothetical protein
MEKKKSAPKGKTAGLIQKLAGMAKGRAAKKKTAEAEPSRTVAAPRVSADAPGVRATEPRVSADAQVIAAPLNRITIDHPKESETVGGFHYSVRLTASACERIELSLDEGPWLHCRNCAGHWWFDLHQLKPGKHAIHVRAHNAGAIFGGNRTFIAR